MKKLVATLSLVALATGAFAQGSVNIANGASTVYHTNTVAGGGATGNATAASGGGNWYYEVFTANSTVTTIDASLQGLFSATWSDTGIHGTNGALAGREAGLTIGVTANWAAGIQQAFLVVGWDKPMGTDWATASAKLLGATLSGGGWTGGGFAAGMFLGGSAIGTAISGPASGPAVALFGGGTAVTTVTEMYTVVPEPGTLALAGLGLASLTIFRRRK